MDLCRWSWERQIPGSQLSSRTLPLGVERWAESTALVKRGLQGLARVLSRGFRLGQMRYKPLFHMAMGTTPCKLHGKSKAGPWAAP